VTHKVDAAENASMVGTDQIRYARLDKDDLTIETPPIDGSVFGNNGKKYKLTLVWKRIK
jgi:hypothetical protein